MIISRIISDEIIRRLNEENSKIIVVYGARQVGKTTLVKNILQSKYQNKNILIADGDNNKDSHILSSRDLDKLADYVKGYDILFIDEAQKIENIGVNLKILYDNFREKLKIIVTGSSSLEIANKIKEPLTGRHHTYHLYPISMIELSKICPNYELMKQLETRLIFGSYPEIFNIETKKDKIAYMENLSSDYLYKDILELQNIRYSKKIRDLLKLLAFQIGSEVSFYELATILEIDAKTVDSYIDLLEKSFVLIRLYGFSRNLRKEINRKPKIYFYDLGIRNSIIGNFNYLDSRNDIGALWENFLIMERIKRNAYIRQYYKKYFWRTYTGAELDYVEEYDGELYGYEFKYNKTAKAPKTWIETYKQEKASFAYVNKDNWLKFVI